MKAPEEILKMSVSELSNYKWSKDLEKENDGCSDCSDCSDCSGCSDCYMCRDAKDLEYAICNVVVGKEAFEAKIKELGINIK
jgi:hypothetical protein